METKSWYLSKTLWFNGLALVVLVASSFGYTGEISPDFAGRRDALNASVRYWLSPLWLY